MNAKTSRTVSAWVFFIALGLLFVALLCVILRIDLWERV